MGVSVRLVGREVSELRDELVERHVRRRALTEQGDPVAAGTAAAEVVDGLLPVSEALDIVVDDRVVGFVWVRQDDDLVAVLDAEGDAALGASLREALLSWARASGAASLDIGVAPGDRLRAAVVDGGGFTLLATNLWLDLAGPVPQEESRISLDPMTDVEFEEFRRDQETSYAAERAASGEPPERAARVARDQLAELLPDGRHSEGQHFFTGREASRPVGVLWLATRGPSVFVYDVVVSEGERGRGLGRALMREAERWAREQQASGVGLNVFGQNVVARRLYDSLGYRVLEDHWQRPVPEASG